MSFLHLHSSLLRNERTDTETIATLHGLLISFVCVCALAHAKGGDDHKLFMTDGRLFPLYLSCLHFLIGINAIMNHLSESVQLTPAKQLKILLNGRRETATAEMKYIYII